MKKPILGLLVLGMLATPLMANASMTGTQIGGSGSPAWTAPSTNLNNYTLDQNPATPRPYVLFDSATANSVTLDFFNDAPGVQFFEYRIDGAAPVSPVAHWAIPGDYNYSGVYLVQGATSLDRVFSATQYVDVRLAVGGESDYRFDWVRFNVAPVPLPAAAWLLLSGLGGLGFVARRRKAA